MSVVCACCSVREVRSSTDGLHVRGGVRDEIMTVTGNFGIMHRPCFSGYPFQGRFGFCGVVCFLGGGGFNYTRGGFLESEVRDDVTER